MRLNFAVVKAMMDAADQDVSDKTASLYAELIKEEYKEFKEAVTDSEKFKEALDLLWVTMGYLIAKDYPIKVGWEMLSENNLSKRDPETGKVLRREDGKYIKPPHYQKLDFKELLTKYEFLNP